MRFQIKNFELQNFSRTIRNRTKQNVGGRSLFRVGRCFERCSSTFYIDSDNHDNSTLTETTILGEISESITQKIKNWGSIIYILKGWKTIKKLYKMYGVSINTSSLNNFKFICRKKKNFENQLLIECSSLRT